MSTQHSNHPNPRPGDRSGAFEEMREMRSGKVTRRDFYQFNELTPVMVKLKSFPVESLPVDPVLAGLQRKKEQAEKVLNAYHEYMRSHS
jgi:hypothetical protein